MSFTRIDRLKNYRIFHDFSWPEDLPSFGRFNVIYGWNGTGKTAISSLFRKIQLKEAIAEGDVRISCDGTTIFGSNFDKAALPAVRVFSRDSINRNVFELPQSEFPALYVFGEHSVSKQRHVQQLKQEREKKVAEQARAERRRLAADQDYENHCADRAREIKNLLTVSGGGPYNNYDKSRYKSSARQLSGRPTASLPLADDERQKCLAMKAAVPLEKIPRVPALPPFHDLSKRIDALLEREVISKAIEELVASPQLAAWVNDGLSLHKHLGSEDLCLFCKQDLPADRLQQLRNHFNDQFRSFQKELGEVTEDVEKAVAQFKNTTLPPRALLYQHLAKDYDAAVSMCKQQSMYIGKYFAALRAALNAKKDQPFKRFSIAGFLASGSGAEPEGGWQIFFLALLAGVNTLGAVAGENAYARLNNLIAQHNRHTENFTEEVRRARELLEQDEVVRSLADYKKRREAREAAANKTTQLQKDLSNLEAQIAALEVEIRQHQRPADELNREMAAYLGRDEIRFSVRQNGYVVLRNNQPAVNLSEGEKTAIAFMYFLKSLSDTGFDCRSGTVVIDDPISSLDANSTYSAFGFMRARTANAGQLFVLTHNFLFFRQVRNWFRRLRGQDRREARFYMLSCTYNADGSRCARIQGLDALLGRYESEYHYLFKRVYEEANRSVIDASMASYYELPNIGRRLLEGFLAFRVPGLAGEPYRQLEALGVEAGRRARLLRFLDTYSHQEQVGFEGQDFALLGEAPAVLRDLLALIQEKDPSHYENMKRLLDEEAANA